MATNTALFEVTPDAVWATLADGWLYGNWVVGTSHMRAVTADWPEVGAKVFHASGLWPAVNRDETVVAESVAPSRLVLTARARPLGDARIVIELRPDGGGTRITMIETPSAGPGRALHNPLTDAMIHRRNREALSRLAALAERRTRPAD